VRIVLTGSSGRIGRAIRERLVVSHEVIGVDRAPGEGTDMVGDLLDAALLERACDGADAVIHAAALHAPHVGLVSEAEFGRVNIDGTRAVVETAVAAGVPRVVFTSTTAVYGYAIVPGRCTWIDEDTTPVPRTVYHRTKLGAESVLRHAADAYGLAVRVLRMSRCFPERAPLMAAYRLHRGVDARDVADAHALALENDGDDYQCYIVSGATPFRREDVTRLAVDAPAVFRERAPALAAAFDARGWALPARVDRVYDASRATAALGWTPRYGFEDVVAEYDRRVANAADPDADR
jgi:nucleoside-diphosphate-sugar epimerase